MTKCPARISSFEDEVGCSGSGSSGSLVSLLRCLARAAGDEQQIFSLVLKGEDRLHELHDLSALYGAAVSAHKCPGKTSSCVLCLKHFRVLGEINPDRAREFHNRQRAFGFGRLDAKMYEARAEMEARLGEAKKAAKMLHEGLKLGAQPEASLLQQLALIEPVVAHDGGASEAKCNQPASASSVLDSNFALDQPPPKVIEEGEHSTLLLGSLATKLQDASNDLLDYSLAPDALPLVGSVSLVDTLPRPANLIVGLGNTDAECWRNRLEPQRSTQTNHSLAIPIDTSIAESQSILEQCTISDAQKHGPLNSLYLESRREPEQANSERLACTHIDKAVGPTCVQPCPQVVRESFGDIGTLSGSLTKASLRYDRELARSQAATKGLLRLWERRARLREALGAWRNVAELSQRQRGIAYFDAMSAEVRAARQTRSAFHRYLEKVHQQCQLYLVTVAWQRAIHTCMDRDGNSAMQLGIVARTQPLEVFPCSHTNPHEVQGESQLSTAGVDGRQGVANRLHRLAHCRQQRQKQRHNEVTSSPPTGVGKSCTPCALDRSIEANHASGSPHSRQPLAELDLAVGQPNRADPSKGEAGGKVKQHFAAVLKPSGRVPPRLSQETQNQASSTPCDDGRGLCPHSAGVSRKACTRPR